MSSSACHLCQGTGTQYTDDGSDFDCDGDPSCTAAREEREAEELAVKRAQVEQIAKGRQVELDGERGVITEVFPFDPQRSFGGVQADAQFGRVSRNITVPWDTLEHWQKETDA